MVTTIAPFHKSDVGLLESLYSKELNLTYIFTNPKNLIFVY